MAGGPFVAGGVGAVVDVLAAVVPGPAVHAHALVAAVRVVARATVLAGVGHQLALVDVVHAELTYGATRRGWSSATASGLESSARASFLHKPVNSGLHWQL